MLTAGNINRNYNLWEACSKMIEDLHRLTSLSPSLYTFRSSMTGSITLLSAAACYPVPYPLPLWGRGGRGVSITYGKTLAGTTPISVQLGTFVLIGKL